MTTRTRFDFGAARRIEQLIAEGAVQLVVDLLTLDQRCELAVEYERECVAHDKDS